MMEDAVVSVATGVLGPLLGKLAELVEKEHAQIKGVRGEITSLWEELRSMNALLQILAAEDDPDALVKEWRNQIRDVSYDVEDCVDDFMRRVEHGDDTTPPEAVGFIQKILAKLKALGACHDIASKIRELKARVHDVSKRQRRYMVFEGSSRSSSAGVPIDARLPALYAAAWSLVGIDGRRQEIMKLLSDGEGELGSGKQLKVVSIVGFGGLGKTTLATEVLRELREQFDCQVIVPVSQSPDIAKILNRILSEVKGRPSHMCNVSDHQELIEQLRSCLLHKRYFIIIDDIWDPYVWEVIRCAFPENNLGSKVITTTRVESVAATCCSYRHEYVYKMEPLSEEDSRRLFFDRIFGSEAACPSELTQVSSQILRKCGGLPLAIITIASLLASQPLRVKEYWENVHKSMGAGVGADSRLEVMRHILNLSFKNLPPNLKTCFLYLGAYPEDSVIWRDDLVRQWAAEGFVGGTDVEAIDAAVICFNELVNRSMIQPVESRYDYDGEVLCCRVHDMMLDLIIRVKSAEENFMTLIERSDAAEIKIKGSTHNVRRLFYHSDPARFGKTPAPALAIDLSKVRSFSTSGSSTYIHRLPELKSLRVLILSFVHTHREECTVDLTPICTLFQLRYLKIWSQVGLQFPTQIRGLQHLETLEIVSYLKQGIDLPADIFQLPRLSFLSILPHMASLPVGIGAMRCLRALAAFVLEEDTLDHIRGLRHLARLKELHVRLPVDERFVMTAEARVDGLCSSLPEHSECKVYLNAWSSEAWFPSVPHWVSRLEKLHSLELGVDEVSGDGVAVLAGLPALARLDLWIRGIPRESIVVAGVGFPVLKCLILTCRTLSLTFEAGAMPVLQYLTLEFNADGAAGEQGECGNAFTGVEHLAGLKVVYARIGGLDVATAAEDSGRMAAVAALRDAVGSHPNRPRMDIIFRQGRYGLR